MQQERRQPLRAGTVIDYCDMRATVVADAGGETIEVDCEGHRQKWRWSFDGASCTVVSVPYGQLAYDSFDAYVKDFPEGELARRWLTNGTRISLAMIRLVDPREKGSPHGGFPGNYMVASVFRMGDGGTRLWANDCDDGMMVRDWQTGAEGEAEALQVLAQLKELAPFSMWDLTAFGLTWD